MRLRDLLGRHRDPSTSADDAPTLDADQPLTSRVQPVTTRSPIRRLLGNRAARKTTAAGRVRWEHGDSITTRVLHVALVGALVSGPAALCWVAVAGPSGPTGSGNAVAESVQPPTRDATVAAAAAQRLVLTWLTASAGDKAAVQALLVGQLPATVDFPEKRQAAPAQMWVGEIDERAAGRFQVTVATSGGPLGAAYFAVPVQVESGAAVALALPARTRSPVAADADSSGLPTLNALSSDDPAFQTAAGYVTANLTGSAELDRWTGPNAHLTALVPRACSGVRVDSVQTVATDDQADLTRGAVIATATCQTTGRPSSTSQYGLVLQVRDGRWEVAAEDPALLLDPTSTPSTTAPSDLTQTPR